MINRYLVLVLIIVLLLPGCSGVLPRFTPQTSENAAVLTLLSQADQNISVGQYQAAGVSLERAIRIEPRNPVLWQKLAQVRLKEGEYRQAENLAAKSSALAPDNRQLRAENWRITGQARQGLGDPEGAETAFKKALLGK
jgi:tetratricopeptide (TPR) repeat protein